MQYTVKTHKIHTDKHKWIHAQWNGPSVTKPNPENCKNCSSKCVYDCAQLQYTIQHRTVLFIICKLYAVWRVWKRQVLTTSCQIHTTGRTNRPRVNCSMQRWLHRDNQLMISTINARHYSLSSTLVRHQQTCLSLLICSRFAVSHSCTSICISRSRSRSCCHTHWISGNNW